MVEGRLGLWSDRKKAEGALENSLKIAGRMLADGIAPEKAAKYAGLSLTKVRSLAAKCN